MCRNIQKLRRPEGPPTEAEIQAAALQFVRKVSGYRTPSKANQAAFDQAIEGVSESIRKLFEQLQVPPGRRDIP